MINDNKDGKISLPDLKRTEKQEQRANEKD